jgi:hypothetical protein
MTREYCRRTVDDIISANYEAKRDKIVEKIRQFFPNFGDVDAQVTGKLIGVVVLPAC